MPEIRRTQMTAPEYLEKFRSSLPLPRRVLQYSQLRMTYEVIGDDACDPTGYDYLQEQQNYIVPSLNQVKNYVQSLVQVQPLAGNNVLSAGSCGGVDLSKVSTNVANSDLHVYVRMVNTELNSAINGDICQQDGSTGRPTFGYLQMQCYKYLYDSSSIPLSTFQGTIQKKIFNVLGLKSNMVSSYKDSSGNPIDTASVLTSGPNGQGTTKVYLATENLHNYAGSFLGCTESNAGLQFENYITSGIVSGQSLEYSYFKGDVMVYSDRYNLNKVTAQPTKWTGYWLMDTGKPRERPAQQPCPFITK